MKINIGPYIDYISPFKIVNDFLLGLGFFEDDAESITDKFLDSKIGERFVDFLIWLDNTRKRKIKIKIHDYDIWNLDHTLSLVIYELLKKYRYSQRYFIPVDNNTSIVFCDDDEQESKRAEQWNEILDRMIFSFDQIINIDEVYDRFYKVKPEFEDCKDFDEILNKINSGKTKTVFDYQSWETHNKKIQEGLDLFAKYFMKLWD